MNKKEILNDYKKKIKLLNIYNQHYYNKNEPKVADREYDILKQDILLLEQKYKFLISNNSPSITVGYKPSRNFKKSLHNKRLS